MPISRPLLKVLLSLALAASPILPAAWAQTASPAAKMSTGKAASAPLIDINTASKSELQALKGVGDKRAEDIIKGRPYKGKDELVQKKILPKGVYQGIKDKIIAKQS